MITYDPLWKLLEDRGIKKFHLVKRYQISRGQMSRLKNNLYVSTHTINMFCEILDCRVEDIMVYIPDQERK